MFKGERSPWEKPVALALMSVGALIALVASASNSESWGLGQSILLGIIVLTIGGALVALKDARRN